MNLTRLEHDSNTSGVGTGLQFTVESTGELEFRELVWVELSAALYLTSSDRHSIGRLRVRNPATLPLNRAKGTGYWRWTLNPQDVETIGNSRLGQDETTPPVLLG
jgi:hypothetical protein